MTRFAQGPADMPDLERVRSMSGLAFMEAVRDGTLPAAPIARLLDFALDSVDAGRVAFRGTPRFDHCNPMGTVHGGWYGTVLDSCMGCAVMTRVPRGSVYTTLEFKVNILRAIPLGTEIVATGWSDHAGRSTGVARGEIRGAENDTLYATGSTTCLVMAMKP
jgi:uncharacterized protein (TIGR00369 family)